MAQNIVNPNYAPVAMQWFQVTVSVSSSASAVAAGVGPFRGLFFPVTSSTVISQDGLFMAVDAVQKNGMLWVQGSFLAIIASASAIYGLR